MKKLICLLLSALLVFGLAACGGSGTQAPAATAAANALSLIHI